MALKIGQIFYLYCTMYCLVARIYAFHDDESTAGAPCSLLGYGYFLGLDCAGR
jgi:hypothetical protein